jgi:hypothetical protein
MSIKLKPCRHQHYLTFDVDSTSIQYCRECGGLRVKYNNVYLPPFTGGWLKPKKKLLTHIHYIENEHRVELEND